jgi:Domain of Unknown Function with PDB structure (DUF3857)
MKHQLCCLFLLAICGYHAYSQAKDSVPPFGQIDKAQLLLNQCDFDKNAEAVVLFDVEDVVCKEYTYTIYSELTRHIRIKILKNKGLDQANVKIPYLSGQDGETIDITDAQTYNLDGSGNIVVSKLDKKSIVNKDVNKKISEKIFIFPDAKIGSVLEYTYKESGPLEMGLDNWNFQTSIPVKFSRYTTTFPQNIELVCKAHCTLPVDVQNRTNRSDNINIFTMSDVPALRDEPYMTCEDDYVQRVESDIVSATINGHWINLHRSWPQIIDMLLKDEDFGQQLTKNIPRTGDLDNMLKPVADPYQRMSIIYRYVRDNMHWNGHTNIWALDGVKSAWKSKKGTSGEINLILVNLLKDAGLDASPVLVSTRSHGRINAATPSWHQFNMVMAMVAIGGHSYVLDATDKYAPPKLIPWEVMYSEGLVIEKFETFKWGWETIWDETQQFNDLILIHGSIDDQGILSGEATVSSFDYSRAQRIVDLKDGKDQFIEKYFGSKNVSVHIDSSSISNEQVDTLPLNQKVWFNTKLSSSGNYRYFSTNLFTGLEDNPFTADRRFSDIFFGANQKVTIAESFFIPEGYGFDEMPKNVKMIMPDTSVVFTRLISAKDDLLSMRVTLEFKKPVFRVDEYDDFREFYKKLFAMLNEQIVIKKVK